jgi:hypothetical protein
VSKKVVTVRDMLIVLYVSVAPVVQKVEEVI